jgi:DNA repair protein RadC
VLRNQVSPVRIASSADLAQAAAPSLRGLRVERVVVVVCDQSGKVLRIARLTDGGSDRTLIPVRDVLSTVLAAGGASFGIAHNHPSGNPEPSGADLQSTARVREGAEAVGLRFLDHVIVTEKNGTEFTTDP